MLANKIGAELESARSRLNDAKKGITVETGSCSNLPLSGATFMAIKVLVLSDLESRVIDLEKQFAEI